MTTPSRPHEHELLSNVALDLRLPLLQIKLQIEQILGSHQLDRQSLQSLGLSADAGLRLLEAYILGSSLSSVTQLQLEPLAIGAVLEDVAAELYDYARQYNTEILVHTPSSLKPILANKSSLTAAISCLAESLVRAQPQQPADANLLIVLGAHSSHDKISAGVYGLLDQLNHQVLSAARALSGRAQQPITGVPAYCSAGVLIADRLFAAVAEPLRVSRRQGLPGLATSFKISKQLAIV